ncbi:plasmid pRiA4b ORF-3 family protein [Nocardiopsis sp. NPDC049922]|uniref:plasmid pRiA4b ORF-3 family protein n=1 Tax=Nocardiopsis sp. NPDC049922 TaxID=3155157 RepID=UPI0033C99CB6
MARRAMSHRVHRLMIVLDDTSPPAWLRADVPSVTRLDVLHRVIQAVLGRHDERPHTFVFNGRHYSDRADGPPVSGPRDRDRDRDERIVRLADVLPRAGTWGIYDLGDGLPRSVIVEDIADALPDTDYPSLLASGGGPSSGGSFDIEAAEKALRTAVGTLPLDEPADAIPYADPARPVTLAPRDELARTALDTPLFGGAVRLARWTAPSRKLTRTGVPSPASACAAVEKLDLWPVDSEEGAAERAEALCRIRTARDLLDFMVPWDAAVGLGLVEVRASTARPADEVHDLETDDERVLDLWTVLFEAVVDGPPMPEGYHGSGIDWSDVLPPTLRSLYEAPDGTEFSLDELADALVPPAEGPLSVPARDAGMWRELMTEILYDTVHELAAIGAVRRTDRTPPRLAALYRPGHVRSRVPDQDEVEAAHETGKIDCSIALTPLGRYGTRELLLDMGIPAPLSGSLAAVGADELLDALATLPPECHAAEVTPWAATRTTEQAVREIADAAAAPTGHGAMRRAMGAVVLNSLGHRTAPALRALLGSERRTVVGLAASTLLSSDVLAEEEGRRMFAEHGPWMVIDSVAGPMELGEDQVSTLFAVNEEADGGSIGRMVIETADALWRVDHPQTVSVLETVGRLHPDRRVAKAARRAAHKARSRG